jgi:hypothetical protein
MPKIDRYFLSFHNKKILNLFFYKFKFKINFYNGIQWLNLFKPQSINE